MKKKLSKNLTNRVRLRPDQLQRVAGGYGNGQIAKYDKDGQQNLALTRALFKGSKTARRFVLFSDQLGRRIYVAKPIDEAAPLTFDLSNALEFLEGYDNAEIKKEYYNKHFTFPFRWLTKRL